MSATGKPTGRPTDFTPDYGDLICERVGNGDSLRTVCRADDMPAMSTVFKWLRLQESFAEQYARAIDERTETFIEDMIEVADDKTLDPNDKRVRVDTRKWIASKLKPKKYGDKLALDGDGAGAPIVIAWAGDKG